MTQCEKFISFFDEMAEETGKDIPEEVKRFREKLLSSSYNAEKPIFTETGLEIMKFLQENDGQYSSKQLSDKMLISSKKISGAMRKLVSDGYVEKMGSSPVIYLLSEQGKNIILSKGE